MSARLPTHAHTVIIGGGIIGCSTAYHLAHLGAPDIVLLERATLTSGSTFHAAGLVGQLRTSANVTQLLKYSVELYERLEHETEQPTGWKRNGGLRLACTPERMIELKRQATTGRSFGLEMHILTPREALDLWPLMDISDLIGAAFLPGDGQANPSDITLALAKSARLQGVRIVQNCPVTAVSVENGRVAAVVTAEGTIRCERVVNCAGQWARQVGLLAGVSVPLVSIQHQYLITEALGAPSTLPTLRDPDRLTYWKEEVGGLVMGGYEPNPLAWAVQGVPEDFHSTLLEADWDHFRQLMEPALARVPALHTTGIRQLLNGPESFTPDGNFILGEAPEVKNFFVGAGFNAFGIASAGGAGKALAEWVLAGEPPVDLWPVDIRRFGGVHRDVEWVRSRTHEMYGKHYTIAWPHEEHESGRPRLTSPLYTTLRARGACFGWKLGWERPNWFARHAQEAADVYSFERPNWFAAVGDEHRACRERVAIFDESSFAKFLLEGSDAAAAVEWLCANTLAKPPGSVTYTQMLNHKGGIEADVTVSRFADDRFYIVTGTGFRTRDFHWIRCHLPQSTQARLTDVTEQMAVLAIMGPRARDVLQATTDADISDARFPFATCCRISVGGAPLWALRVTYVGELGWELHVERSHAESVYNALRAAGAAHGIADAGYRAIESLRLEKGYRAWGADIGPDYTPLEAGLGWAVKLASEVPFLGREALLEQQRSGLRKRFATFTVGDPTVVLLGRETIYRNGARVGWLSSGGYGYTLATNIGCGYVRDPAGVTPAMLRSGTYELEVATERVPCQLHLQPLYDPQMTKIKC